MGNQKDELFRKEAVKLALRSQQSHSQTARDLGIKAGTLYHWISKYKSETGCLEVKEVNLLAENRRLQKENLRLKEEREILKKAAKFFANESK